ncbi:MAG TPA: hypothetical protein VK470_08820 [Bacteroidota bacterium]|nr:hypothetical protein [Bacteroidota bacterium]
MNNNSGNCAHNCRNTCATLVEILRRESALMQLYDQVIGACDDPETRELVSDLKERRGAIIDQIVAKLNRLRAQGEILDGIMGSYDTDPA